MLSYALKRLVQSLIVILLMTIVIFIGIWFIGNPADALISPDATMAEREAAIVALGLDKPLWQQYLDFLSGVFRGDFGNSFVYRAPVTEILAARLPASLELAFVSFVIAVSVSIPLGLYAGLRPQSPFSQGIMGFSLVGVSIPQFWQGMVLIIIFGITLSVLPVGGRGETATFLGITSSLWTWDGLAHLILPAVNMALLKMSLLIRVTRAAVMEVSRLDYVTFARAKGVRKHRIVTHHILRNVLLPIVTVLGIEIGNLIAYAVITETVFSWPGLGRLLISSVQVLDRPMILAYLCFTAMLFIFLNFIVDILYTYIDPRVRDAIQAGGRK
ncbi:ABC transporter permease [Telmatospirillum sp. J64-1]|uniref:ABC transporter permease n=1 Tax=Telmatospirillum sp. J64-1 TaxID=2502183 RepID=UPI00115F304D|nr:ABC transporter permease [Telmatospirillum sp. J64-1]